MTLSIEAATRKDKRTAQTRKADGLQHRHFAFIAATLASLKPPKDCADYDAMPAWDYQVHYWADACARGNPRFDRAWFLRACGVSP